MITEPFKVSNWYNNKFIKQANQLAQLLGLDVNSAMYKLIQKYEQQLKKDGNWLNVKGVRKEHGNKEAISFLKDVFSDYTIDTNVTPPEKTSRGILHRGRTPTGGDWFLYRNPGGLDELFNKLDDSSYEDTYYENARSEASDEVMEEYKEFAQGQIDEKLSEIEESRSRVESNIENMTEEEYETKIEELDDDETEYSSLDQDLAGNFLDADALSAILDALGHHEDIESLINDKATEKWQEHKDEISSEIESERDELLSITCGGGWCVSQESEHTDEHLSQDHSFLVLRRNGNPRLAIVFDDDYNQIVETRGINNSLESLTPLDIIDIHYSPMFDFEDIFDSLAENEGDLHKLFFETFLELDDEDISNKHIDHAIERMMPEILETMHDAMAYESAPFAYVIEKIQEASTGGNQRFINYIISNINSYFVESSENNGDIIEDIINSYSDENIGIITRLVQGIHESSLILYLHDQELQIQSSDFPEKLREGLSQEIHILNLIFGEKTISDHIKMMQNPYYNLSQLDENQILKFLFTKEYKNVDINKIMSGNLKSQANIFKFIANQLQYMTDGGNSATVNLLNNYHEMSQDIVNGYPMDKLATEMSSLIMKRILEMSSSGEYGSIDCNKILKIVNNYESMGLHPDFMAGIKNSPHYTSCLNPNAIPQVVEGLPNAGTPQMLPPVTTGNWYSKSLYKQANTLAKSLGIPSESVLFKEVQKFESMLKRTGDWSKILNTKRSKGVEAALLRLREVINKYQLDKEDNPPEVESSKIRHVARTSTGGDWYFFENSELGEDDSEEDYDNWAYENHDWLEDNYLDYFRSGDKIEHDFEGHWEKLMEKLDEKMKEYLTMFGEREAKNKQESMSFYENPQILRLKKRYQKIKEQEEARLNDAIKKAKEAYTVDDLIYSYEEYMGEELAARFASNLRSDFEDYARQSWEDDYEARDEAKDQKLREQTEDYFKLTCGARWCISQPGDHLEEYLKDGFSFLVLRRNKEARVAIRFMDGSIEEIQGIHNDFDNINELDFLDLIECPLFETEDIMDGLRDGSDYVDDDQRSDAFLIRMLELDNEVAQFASIRESIESNTEEISQFLTSNIDIENLITDGLDKVSNMINDGSEGFGFNLIKEKIFQIFRKRLEEDFDDVDSSWGETIINMMNMKINIDLIRDFFGPYKSKILNQFFESVSASGDNYKMWVEQEALSYLYNIFGQDVVEYARRHGFEKANNDQLSRQDTINYIANNYYLVYGAEKFKNNPDAVHYVANTILMGSKEPHFIRVLNNLYDFLNVVMPEMKTVYGKDIAEQIVSLAIKYSEDIYPNDPTNQRTDIISQLLIQSANKDSSRYLDPELVALIHNDDRIRHLKEMRKRLDYNAVPDPSFALVYPENQPPAEDNDDNIVQASFGNWYKNEKLIYNSNK